MVGKLSIRILRPILGAAAVFCAVPAAARAQDSTSVEPVSWAWGSDRAIIEVVEFTDFGCPYCARFHSDSYATLFTEYVETGKARWVFVPFASGRFPGAAEATAFAVCAAEQGKDVAYLRRTLFERQSGWSVGDASATLAAYAVELGLDAPDYHSCVSSDGVAARLEENRRRATKAGVRGTPTLFVEGFPVMGALPTDFYQRLFDSTIERVQRGRRVSMTRTPFPASRP